MIRARLSALAGSAALGGIIGRMAGSGTLDDAVSAASGLGDAGYWVGLEYAVLVADCEASADEALGEYHRLVDRLATDGLASICEAAIVPESFGAADGVITAAAFARLDELVDHAATAGVQVMVGPSTDVARMVSWAASTVSRGRLVGVTLQAAMRRTEADCATLASGRVRLVKGGGRGLAEPTYSQPIEVDKAFVRCARKLLNGEGEPSFATHDDRLVDIVEALAARHGRAPDSFEFSFHPGHRDATQRRLAAAGGRVRLYVPYGPQRFERLVGGLTEHPSTIAAAVRSMLPGASA